MTTKTTEPDSKDVVKTTPCNFPCSKIYIKEENALKFYYFEAENSYIVGKRADTMYYARVEYVPSCNEFCMSYFMSRYLPWGTENYPKEPKEISLEEWLPGFIRQNQEVLFKAFHKDTTK